jgi:DNA repair protein RecN (Recombination protein N)
MLIRLLVENFALAEQTEIEPAAGLNVLTGETGAGKSLLVDALSLLQGGRGAAEFIRTGADSAVIEATFQVAGPAIENWLAERGIAPEGGEVTLRRVLNRDGRHRMFVNGGQMPATAGAELAGLLLEIHGQHEQQNLLSPAAHLALLDDAADAEKPLGAYHELYREKLAIEAERAGLEEAARDRERRLDFARFQLEEIEKVSPRAGEWESLDAERRVLENADRLAAVCAESEDMLYSGDGAAAVRLRTISKRLDEAVRYDDRFSAWAAEAKELSVRAEELARSLAGYAEKTEADPRRLDAVNARLDDLMRLKRKFGDLEDIQRQAEELRKECESLENSDARLAKLTERLTAVSTRLNEAGLALRKLRHKAAAPFARKIEAALRPLGMTEATVEWRFRELEQPSPQGLDGVELLLSANRGEPAKPLQKVASGGELSRVMLALHTVSLQAGGPACVIFDEIDAGIGGDIGNAVGEALKRVAENRQVICVTHLAQIAAYAREHWLVQKSAVGERTVSSVRKLTAKERQEEIGRMLGGRVDDASRKHARALLERASA